MSLRPLIIVGCGGAGGRVLAALRDELLDELEALGWSEGLPLAWQLICIDSPAIPEDDPSHGGASPAEDYVSLSGGESVYRNVDAQVVQRSTSAELAKLIGWRPAPSMAVLVNHGAGQLRAVGRIAFLAAEPRVGHRLSRALDTALYGVEQLKRLADQIGVPSLHPRGVQAIVVSSLGGGTGAGVFLDVAELLRTMLPVGAHRTAGVLLMPDLFEHVGPGSGIQANALASLSELIASAYAPELRVEPSYDASPTRHSGLWPAFTVGRSTLDGQLLDSADCLRTAVQALASIALRPEIAQSILDYPSANDVIDERSFPIADAGRRRSTDGCLNSLGAAKLVVGGRRFSNYSIHRIARAAVEELITTGSTTRSVRIASGRSPDRFQRFAAECGFTVSGGGNMGPALEGILWPAEAEIEWHQWESEAVSAARRPAGASSARCLQIVSDLVHTRGPDFLGASARRSENVETQLRASLPHLLAVAASQAILSSGLTVTISLISTMRDALAAGLGELSTSASRSRTRGQSWAKRCSAILRSSEIDSKSAPTDAAFRTAVIEGLSAVSGEARARSSEQAAKWVRAYVDEVVGPLLETLRQVLADLTTSKLRAELMNWPTNGPMSSNQYLPPANEITLIEPAEWPGLFEKLLSETRAGETSGATSGLPHAQALLSGNAGEEGRRFLDDQLGTPLLTYDTIWSGGRVVPVCDINRDALLARAHAYVSSQHGPFRTTVESTIGSYLSPEENGRPVADHLDRLNKFESGLSRAIAAASPLVRIDRRVASGAPRDNRNELVSYAFSPLPPLGQSARAIVERVLATSLGGSDPLVETAHNYASDVGSVQIVARLAFPIPASAVASLISPIAAAWREVTLSGSNAIDAFWRDRRARTLTEFIPLSSHVLDEMIKGWFIGRLLGLISDADAQAGITIYQGSPFGLTHTESTTHRFPWPLLRCGANPDLASDTFKSEWLPALLESYSLAIALVPDQPDLMVAYEHLYRLGESDVLLRWIEGAEDFSTELGPPSVSSAERQREAQRALSELRVPYAGASQVGDSGGGEVASSVAPFGFELFPRIVDQIDALLRSISFLPSTRDAL